VLSCTVKFQSVRSDTSRYSRMYKLLRLSKGQYFGERALTAFILILLMQKLVQADLLIPDNLSDKSMETRVAGPELLRPAMHQSSVRIFFSAPKVYYTTITMPTAGAWYSLCREAEERDEIKICKRAEKTSF